MSYESKASGNLITWQVVDLPEWAHRILGGYDFCHRYNIGVWYAADVTGITTSLDEPEYYPDTDDAYHHLMGYVREHGAVTRGEYHEDMVIRRPALAVVSG